MKKKRSFVIMIISVLIGAVLLSACQNGGGSRGLMGSEPQSSRVLQEYYELIDIKLEENEILKNSSNISYYFPSFFVSPYAEDEEIDALAEMLSDVSMDKMLKRDFASVDICCYSDLLRVDLTKKCGKDQMLEQIGELFDKESPKGISAFDAFRRKLTGLGMVEESDSGELYIIINDDDFNNDMVKLADTLDEIKRNDPLQDWHVRDYSYTYGINGSKGTAYYGYTGESISVYENSYSPDKKLSDRPVIEAGMIYDDIFKAVICDPDRMGPGVSVLRFDTSYYKNNKYDYILLIDWIESGDNLSLTELADCTYGIYQTAYTTMETKGITLDLTMSISAVSSDGGYNNTEVERVYISLDMNGIYTRQEWEKKIRAALTREFESEPV